MRRAWPIAIGLAALALVAAAVLAGSSGPGRRRDGPLARLPSAESPGPRGLAVAAAWLGATGRPWARLAAPEDAPPPGATWLLVAPARPLGEADAAALLAHAARGHLVVWAMGEAPQPALAAALGARWLPGRGAGERTVAGAPGDPLLDGLTLRTGEAGVASDRPGARAAATGAPGEPPAAVTVPVGRGAVLLLAGPAALDNAHLAAGDALSLWVRLAARGPVAFDERWLAPVRPAPVTPPVRAATLAALQAVLAALALLLAVGPRFGAVRRRPPRPRGAPPATTSRRWPSSTAAAAPSRRSRPTPGGGCAAGWSGTPASRPASTIARRPSAWRRAGPVRPRRSGAARPPWRGAGRAPSSR